jgi:hypothetical protein
MVGEAHGKSEEKSPAIDEIGEKVKATRKEERKKLTSPTPKIKH